MRVISGVAAAFLIAANALHAQETPAADSAGPHTVTSVTIKSGKLALSTAANPGPVFLPDGAYSNEAKTVIVVLDGRILRVEYGSGSVSQVASVRVQRQGVMLTPPVTALMAVSPFPLPSGTFTSQDGAHSFKVMSGRPVELHLGATTPPE